MGEGERWGGGALGASCKKPPNPQELFLNLSLTEPTRSGKATRDRCSKVNSMPPEFSRRTPCKAGSAGNAGGKPSLGACFSGSACAASGLMLGVPGAVAPAK